MDVRIEKGWKDLLATEFDKSYFSDLTQFVHQEYKQRQVFPPGRFIFNAFDLCPFEHTKVIIFLQLKG